MEQNNQSIRNSSNSSSISQSSFGSSSSISQPIFSNVVPNQSSVSPSRGSGNGNGIGSSSSSCILHDSHISSSDLSHERILVGFLVTDMVMVETKNDEKQPMVRLVRSKTSVPESQNIIKVVTINNILVGYIKDFIADLLVPLIDSKLISIQGVTMPLSGRCIPCEVHVFAKMEVRDRVIDQICRPGVNFILANSEHFQSSCVAGILHMEEPKTVDEQFSLMEKEESNERALEPMEAPTDAISTQLIPLYKNFTIENTIDLPPF